MSVRLSSAIDALNVLRTTTLGASLDTQGTMRAATQSKVYVTKESSDQTGDDLTVDYDTVAIDVLSEFDADNAKFTATATGRYLVVAEIEVSDPSGDEEREVYIYKNNSTAISDAFSFHLAIGGKAPVFQFSSVVDLTATDYFVIKIESSTSLTVYDSSFTNLSITRIM